MVLLMCARTRADSEAKEAPMTLPVTLVEAEALEFAREWIARGQEGDFIGLGCAPLHHDAGRAFARRLLGQFALLHPRNMLDLIETANAGWDEARFALVDLILEFTNRGEPLPAFLSTYNAHMVTGRVPPSPRGQKKSTNIVADIAIMVLIMELVERFGLKVRRNEASEHPSACSIVATALSEAGLDRGTEEAIRKIWRRYSPKVLPGRLVATE
jgi:hypothetical protein